MIIGREPVPFAMMPPFDGTRYQMRRELEASFWTRIQKHVVDAEWRAVEIGWCSERTLNRFQITGYPEPFAASDGSGLVPSTKRSQIVFEAIDRTIVRLERDSRELEAAEYIKAWAQGRGKRIKVEIIEKEIARKFAHYNFTERGVRRIRMRAGLKQRRGNFSLPD